MVVWTETFASFSEALSQAKRLAVRSGRVVPVTRVGDRWSISALKEEHRAEGSKLLESELRAGDYTTYDEDWADRDLDREELLEELASDQEDWARSNEEGWYYES